MKGCSAVRGTGVVVHVEQRSQQGERPAAVDHLLREPRAVAAAVRAARAAAHDAAPEAAVEVDAQEAVEACNEASRSKIRKSMIP